MEFQEITEELKATPGEYIYHTPTQEVVLCGSFNREKGIIKVLSRGKLFSDVIKNFKKIKLTNKAEKRAYVSKCKGCKK